MLKLMQEKGLVDRDEAARSSVWSARVSRETASTSLVRRLIDLRLRRLGPQACWRT